MSSTANKVGGGGGVGGSSNGAAVAAAATATLADKRASPYTRQATILRKNLMEWDRMLRNPRGEDWPTMLGRLNAALNQTATMDRSIDDVWEHFVYLPKQATANPGDIPFFLSTRLEFVTASEEKKTNTGSNNQGENSGLGGMELLPSDPALALSQFETDAAQLAAEYEEIMVRF